MGELGAIRVEVYRSTAVPSDEPPHVINPEDLTAVHERSKKAGGHCVQ